MDAPILLTQPAPIQPLTSKTIVKKRQPLEPRSSGFVVPSKSAEYREYEDAHHFHGIRDFLSEKHGTLSGDDPKLMRRRHFFATSKHLRKIFQLQPKLEEAINLPIAYHKTWDGHQYRQIYNPGNTVSTYEVNNIKRPTASKRSRKSPTLSERVSKGSQSEQLTGNNAGKAEDAVEEQSARWSEGERHISRRQSHEATAIEELSTQTLASKFANQCAGTPKGQSSKYPRPYIDTPAIPLSPMKVSLEEDCVRGPSSQHAHQSPTPSCEPSQEPKDLPIIRDYAIDVADKCHQYQARQREPRSPDKKRNKKANEGHTLAGMSHDYFGFPSVKRPIKDPQDSVMGNNNYVASGSTPAPPNHPPPVPPSSPLMFTPEITTGPNFPLLADQECNLPFIVTADLSTKHPASDPSSGMLSDAQHASSMRSQTAAEHYMSGARQPPSPGPAPIRALPLVPEVQSAAVVSTLKASGSVQRREGTKCSPTKKSRSRVSPKKHEYSFFPAKYNSPKVSRPTSPVQKHTKTMSDVTSPLPFDGRIEQYMPPKHVIRDTSKGDLDTAQVMLLQTAGRKATDLTSATRQIISVEPHRVAAPQARESVQQPDSIQLSLNTEPRSITTPAPLQPTTSSQTLSPITVVAEQEPSYPPPSRMHSQKSHISHASTDTHYTNRRRVDGHPLPTAPQQGTSPLIHLPGTTTEVSFDSSKPQPRPLSTSSLSQSHSTSASRPTTLNLASRDPTPDMHALLRSHSTRSGVSHRASIISSKREHSQVSELEARLAAIEKKNIMLERAFLAVINAGGSLDLGGGHGDGENGAMGDGMSNGYEAGDGNENGHRKGDGTSIGERGGEGSRACRESVASGESLYSGLEHLLAVHAGDMGVDRRASGGSGI